mgnify:CR=1 FL=1
MDNFITVDKSSKGEYRDRGSKFLAFLFPVSTENDFRSHLNKLRNEHKKANHHCYAFKLSRHNLHRYTDDGEPSGSAGRPIMGVIEKQQLNNVLIVVVRYFGGVKLGVRGLIDAYSGAAQEAVKGATLKKEWIYRHLEVTLEYSALGFIERFIEQNKLTVIEASYEAQVKKTLGIVPSNFARVKDKLEGELKQEFGSRIETPYPVKIKPKAS